MLVWLVQKQPRFGKVSRAETLQVGTGRKTPDWHFHPSVLEQWDWDVVNARLKDSGFPPWPRSAERGKFVHGFLTGDVDNVEDDWSPFKSRLYKARGRIVGGAIIDLPGEVAISELQLHSAEHRVWCHGTLPMLRDRLAAFKILDVFALGSFASNAAGLQADSQMLHPARVAVAHRIESPADVFEILPECSQDMSHHVCMCHVACIVSVVPHPPRS